jgi:hypothetical protein
MISTEEVQKLLNNIDWAGYHAKVSWAIRRPSCSFYDGSIVCPYWRNWIESGASLFSTQKEHFDNAAKEISSPEKKASIREIVAKCWRDKVNLADEEITGIRT